MLQNLTRLYTLAYQVLLLSLFQNGGHVRLWRAREEKDNDTW